MKLLALSLFHYGGSKSSKRNPQAIFQNQPPKNIPRPPKVPCFLEVFSYIKPPKSMAPSWGSWSPNTRSAPVPPPTHRPPDVVACSWPPPPKPPGSFGPGDLSNRSPGTPSGWLGLNFLFFFGGGGGSMVCDFLEGLLFFFKFVFPGFERVPL